LRNERGFLQRIDAAALSRVRRTVDADDVLTAFEKRFQHALAECLLSVDNDAHDVSPESEMLPHMSPSLHRR